MRTSSFTLRMHLSALRIPAALLCIATALPGITVPALAEAPAQIETAAPVDCLPTHQINNTRIIDDQTIQFRTGSNRWYENRLPHKCSGLKSAGKFAYTTSLPTLCKVDTITVLQNYGSSFSRGASCGLGVFTPIAAPGKKNE